MARAAVIYYSRGGTTGEMAELLAAAITKAGVPTDCVPVEEAIVEDLPGYDAIVLGSPSYYGQMAAPIKKLLDDLVTRHGRLDGKVGAAFASSANVAGGNETTVVGLLQAMLVAGMVVQGDPQGDHYGPVGIGEIDDRVRRQCERRGRRIAELTLRLAS